MSANNLPAVEKMFKFYFECMIPQHYLLINDVSLEYGIPTSGDKKVDRELAQTVVRAQLTPVQMVEYFENGATIEFVHRGDSAKVYRILTEHLKDWKVAAQNNIGWVNVPTEDLRRIDDFVTHLFPVARHFLKEDTRALGSGGLMDSIAALEARRGVGRFKKSDAEETEFPTEHASLVKDLTSQTKSHRNRWR